MLTKDEIIKKITEYGIKNSFDLFTEMEGEFYPFGIIMDSSFLMTPFHDASEEYPASDELILKLRKDLNNYILKHTCACACICYLASKKVNNVEYDLLVLEIIFGNSHLNKIFWYIIDIDKNQNTFEVEYAIDLDEL